MVRTLPLNSETRPELPRILAIAAAIAVHAFAFLLLLIPMAAPPLQALVDSKPDVIFLPPKDKIVEVPMEKAKPDPVRSKPAITQPTEHAKPKINDTPVIVDQGTLAAEESAVTDPGPVIDATAVTGPISVGNLGYIKATPPPYPRVEARAGIGGTVLLKVLVDVDGRPLEVVVLESSGNKSLDRSAREHVLKSWLFQPAMRDGKAVQAYGKVPVVFSMQ